MDVNNVVEAVLEMVIFAVSFWVDFVYRVDPVFLAVFLGLSWIWFAAYVFVDIFFEEPTSQSEDERVIDRLDRTVSLMYSTPSRSPEQARVRELKKHAQRQAEARARARVENVRLYQQQVREKEATHHPNTKVH